MLEEMKTCLIFFERLFLSCFLSTKVQHKTITSLPHYTLCNLIYVFNGQQLPFTGVNLRLFMHWSQYLLSVNREIFSCWPKLFNFQVIFTLLCPQHKNLSDIFFKALLHDQVIKNKFNKGLHRRDIIVKDQSIEVVLNVRLCDKFQLWVELCVLHWRAVVEMPFFVEVWVVPSMLKLIFR